MRVFLTVFIVLFAVSLLTYRGALQGEFIIEDSVYLLNDEFRVPIDALHTAFAPRPEDNFYRPLTRVYNSLTVALFQENIQWHRLLNILWLALSGALIFALIRSWSSDMRVAVIAAGLFCIHPINSTPVLYLSMPVMPYAVFFLLSMLCFQLSFDARRRMDLLAVSLISFSLSFLVHEITLCLPLYVFLYAWQLCGAGFWMSVRQAVPFGVIALIYLVLRLTFVSNSLDVVGLHGYITAEDGVTFTGLLTTIVRNIALYLSKLFVPEGILWNLRIPDQGRSELLWMILPLLVAVAMFFVFRRRARGNVDLFMLLWFLAGFIMLAATSFVHPSSGIGIEPHWFIASSAGFFGLTARGFLWIRAKGFPERIWKFSLAGLVLYLGFFTNVYSVRWQQQKHYMEYWLTQDATADLPNFWLAQIFQREGNHQQAVHYYCRSLTGGFIDWEVYYNLGNIYHKDGFFDKAIAYYNQAHRLKPDSAEIHHNAAMSYFSKGNARRAEELLVKAQALAPASQAIQTSLQKVRECLQTHE